MPSALLGKKLGMTRVFVENGGMVPVTVIETGPCSVLQIRTQAKDGYEALQIGFDDRVTGEQWDRIRKRFGEKKIRGNVKGLRRPEIGHALKAGKAVRPKRFIREVSLLEGEAFSTGDEITLEVARGWKKVDVVGHSKGRGMQGTMRAWNFSSGPNSHGSKCRRIPGSIGLCATPARVLKGKKMYTRWGNERCTVRNLDVVAVDVERNLLLVRGAVPGPKQGYLYVRKAVATRVAQ